MIRRVVGEECLRRGGPLTRAIGSRTSRSMNLTIQQAPAVLVGVAPARHSSSRTLSLLSSSSSSSSFPFHRLFSTAAVQHDPYDDNCTCTSCSCTETCFEHPDGNVYCIDKDEQCNDVGIINSFQVLNLPQTFNIDKNELKRSYRTLMNNYHPDKHSNLPPAELLEQEHRASVVTRAFDVLKDDHTRAIHLLEVLGKSVLDEAANGQLVGSEFLMYIMEIREEIQLTNEDRTLKRMLLENKQRQDQTCDELSQAFESEQYQIALELTARLQYYHRIDETIRDKIQHID